MVIKVRENVKINVAVANSCMSHDCRSNCDDNSTLVALEVVLKVVVELGRFNKVVLSSIVEYVVLYSFFCVVFSLLLVC